MAPLYIRVSGRVQGVGFRWYVRQAADRLGLAGWVRNRPDGSVEIAVDGPEPAQEQFLSAARRGPPGVDVEHVEHLAPEALHPPISAPFRIVR